jgi:hypothetical protein
VRRYECAFCGSRHSPEELVRISAAGWAFLFYGVALMALSAVLLVLGAAAYGEVIVHLGLQAMGFSVLWALVGLCLRERRRVCPDCDEAVWPS